jgi:hypothetical protein
MFQLQRPIGRKKTGGNFGGERYAVHVANGVVLASGVGCAKSLCFGEICSNNGMLSRLSSNRPKKIRYLSYTLLRFFTICHLICFGNFKNCVGLSSGLACYNPVRAIGIPIFLNNFVLPDDESQSNKQFCYGSADVLCPSSCSF